MSRGLAAWVGVGALACGPAVAPSEPSDEESTSSTSAASSTGVDPTTSTTGTTDLSTSTPVDASTTEVSSSGSSTGIDPSSFIGSPDGGVTGIECSIWKEDCPPGEKCMPWAAEAGPWNATRCTPIADQPGDPGDPCTVEGSGISGIDDCRLHAMCFSVDPETNTGICVGMCLGSEADPICPDPDTRCRITHEGVLALCQTPCDPLLQDCPYGLCIWSDWFWCDPPRQSPLAGDPCEFGYCGDDYVCIGAADVPGCLGDHCCSEFCALDAADPLCFFEGQSCVPWFDPGEAPPEYENVGVCAVP